MRRRIVCALAALSLVVGFVALDRVAGPARKTSIPRTTHRESTPASAEPLRGASSNEAALTASDHPSTPPPDAPPFAYAASELPDSIRAHPWKAPFYCPADFNKDDEVDNRDADLYFTVYAAGDGPMASWLDMTGDGAVDSEDVASFFTSWMNGDCDTAQRAILREEVCAVIKELGEEHPTVTIADGAVHVSGNGLSITSSVQDGAVTTMMISRLYLAQPQIDVIPVFEEIHRPIALPIPEGTLALPR